MTLKELLEELPSCHSESDIGIPRVSINTLHSGLLS